MKKTCFFLQEELALEGIYDSKSVEEFLSGCLEPPVYSVCTSEMYGPLFSIQHSCLSSTISRKMDTLKVTTTWISFNVQLSLTKNIKFTKNQFVAFYIIWYSRYHPETPLWFPFNFLSEILISCPPVMMTVSCHHIAEKQIHTQNTKHNKNRTNDT